MLNGLDLVFGFPAPVILALLINEIRFRKFKRFAQTVIYLPHFLSWIIIGGIAVQLLADGGLINIMLRNIGIDRIQFLTENRIWLVTYCAIGIWQSAGWGTIIYLAAITGINPELYDAANVDGASRFKMVLHVTIPGILPTVVILLILNLGRMAAIGFDRPFLIGNTLVREYSDVISTYAYRTGIRSGYFSQATAVGFFQSAVNVFFLFTANYIAQRIDDQHGLF
jgi:putative aldouronate transport system permease protein